jgi:hypothetical protein
VQAPPTTSHFLLLSDFTTHEFAHRVYSVCSRRPSILVHSRPSSIPPCSQTRSRPHSAVPGLHCHMICPFPFHHMFRSCFAPNYILTYLHFPISAFLPSYFKDLGDHRLLISIASLELLVTCRVTGSPVACVVYRGWRIPPPPLLHDLLNSSSLPYHFFASQNLYSSPKPPPPKKKRTFRSLVPLDHAMDESSSDYFNNLLPFSDPH